MNSGHLSVKNLTSVGCGALLITQLAFVFGKRKDVVFKELKALLDPFGINRYYTDGCGFNIMYLCYIYHYSMGKISYSNISALFKRPLALYVYTQGFLGTLYLSRTHTNDWGAYERHLDAEKHEVGK